MKIGGVIIAFILVACCAGFVFGAAIGNQQGINDRREEAALNRLVKHKCRKHDGVDKIVIVLRNNVEVNAVKCGDEKIIAIKKKF